MLYLVIKFVVSFIKFVVSCYKVCCISEAGRVQGADQGVDRGHRNWLQWNTRSFSLFLPIFLLLPFSLSDVVVYHVPIEASGHWLFQKFWPLLIYWILRILWSSYYILRRPAYICKSIYLVLSIHLHFFLFSFFVSAPYRW